MKWPFLFGGLAFGSLLASGYPDYLSQLGSIAGGKTGGGKGCFYINHFYYMILFLIEIISTVPLYLKVKIKINLFIFQYTLLLAQQ